MSGGFRELGVGLIAVTAPVIYPFFRSAFWVRGPYVPADRRHQLQLLRRHPPRQHQGGYHENENGEENDDDGGASRRSGVFGYGKRRDFHDTAIELQAIDEQLTAFALLDDDDDTADTADTADKETGRPGPRGHRRRTISSSTTIVASVVSTSRQPSLRQHCDGGPDERDGPARKARPGSSEGSTGEAMIEETDWALRYMAT